MSQITFICGDDEFLVANAARKAFEDLTGTVSDEFAIERIDGTALNADEAANIADRFVSAVRTVSMFGESKVVWLRKFDLWGAGRTATSEGGKAASSRIFEELQGLGGDDVRVLISAFPVNRSRREIKWLKANAETKDFKVEKRDGTRAVELLLENRVEELGIRLGRPAMAALIGKTGGDSRLALNELEKLATFLGDGGTAISESLVMALVPDLNESDFFEPVEAFFEGDLKWTLDALNRYFFNNDDARALLTMLARRGRLTIQVRALVDAGHLPSGARGISASALSNAETAVRPVAPFPPSTEKSGFNLFSQSQWYVARLAKGAELYSLKRLLDFQVAFNDAFWSLIADWEMQPEILRDLAIRCLSTERTS